MVESSVWKSENSLQNKSQEGITHEGKNQNLVWVWEHSRCSKIICGSKGQQERERRREGV
jgi:hypothetical protein